MVSYLQVMLSCPGHSVQDASESDLFKTCNSTHHWLKLFKPCMLVQYIHVLITPTLLVSCINSGNFKIHGHGLNLSTQLSNAQFFKTNYSKSLICARMEQIVRACVCVCMSLRAHVCACARQMIQVTCEMISLRRGQQLPQ